MSTNELAFSMNDTLVQSVARLVDDAGATREPSHSDLENTFERVGLSLADPHSDPASIKVGKQKRVRHVLQWAMDNDEDAGVKCVASLIALVRGVGGFRSESPNFVGADAVETCIGAFADQPVEMTRDGMLRPRSLEGLSGRNLSDALRSYVIRAQRGHEDSVLVAGTDKDLIEATAGHVVLERYGVPPVGNFQTLLGQAFVAVGLDAQRPSAEVGGIEGARTAMTASLYEMGCAINRLRNKAGGGHGRPFIPDLTSEEVRAATEGAGLVAGRLLDALASYGI